MLLSIIAQRPVSAAVTSFPPSHGHTFQVGWDDRRLWVLGPATDNAVERNDDATSWQPTRQTADQADQADQARPSVKTVASSERDKGVCQKTRGCRGSLTPRSRRLTHSSQLLVCLSLARSSHMCVVPVCICAYVQQVVELWLGAQSGARGYRGKRQSQPPQDPGALGTGRARTPCRRHRRHRSRSDRVSVPSAHRRMAQSRAVTVPCSAEYSVHVSPTSHRTPSTTGSMVISRSLGRVEV